MTVLKYPLATEKAIKLIENENVITYIVDNRSTKTQIKKEFERLFNVKVKKIRTANMPTNIKKAYLKISKDYRATDISEKLQLI